jgi:hypothetical protein
MEWNKKKIDGKCFDDVFQVDGIPLWWFFKRLAESTFLPERHGFFFREYMYWSEQLKKRIVGKGTKKKEKNEEEHKKEQKTILFLSYTNHLRNGKYFRIQHLLDGIEKDSELSSLVVTIDPFSQFSVRTLQEINHPYRYLTTEIEERARTQAKKFARKWKRLPKDHLFDNAVPSRTSIFFSYELLYITLFYYELFKKILREENVKAVYTSAMSSLYEKCLLAAASTMNIHSFMGQHGVGAEFVNNDVTHLYSMNFLVMGNKYKEELMDKGIAEKNIFVTGPQIFEELVPYIKKERDQRKNEGTILFMTSPFIEDGLLTESDYFTKMKKIIKDISISGKKLVIKLHPREKTINIYQQIVNELGIDAEVCGESTREHHYKLIWECDVLVNFGSTVALEAMILGRPTITIDPFDGENPINPFIRESNATVKVKYHEDIKKIVQEILEHPDVLEKEVHKFVRDHCSIIDGKTTERVLDVIKSKLA